MKVVWLKAAQKQLDEIYDFMAQQSARAAISIYNDIIDETDKLCLFPEMAALEPLLEGEAYSYRSLIVRRTYKVVYRVNKDLEEIIVASVWDCRRDPDKLQKSVQKEQNN
jgi:plasmid stabilization system protein ParE